MRKQYSVLLIAILFFVVPLSTFAADKVLGQWREEQGYYTINTYKIIKTRSQYQLIHSSSYKEKIGKPQKLLLTKQILNGQVIYKTRTGTGDYFIILSNGDLEIRDGLGLIGTAKRF